MRSRSCVRALAPRCAALALAAGLLAAATGLLLAPGHAQADSVDEARATLEAEAQAGHSLVSLAANVGGSVSLDQAKDAWSQARQSAPWAAWGASYLGSDNEHVTAVRIHLTCPLPALAERTETYWSTVEALGAEAATEPSTIRKALAASDLVSARCSFDDGYRPDDADQSPTTPAGALLEGQAVCSGYTRAFRDVCEAAGVPCVVVVSDDEAHAWNQINVNGAWYNVDVTWDDAQNTHDYFGLSDEDYETRTGFTSSEGQGCFASLPLLALTLRVR